MDSDVNALVLLNTTKPHEIEQQMDALGDESLKRRVPSTDSRCPAGPLGLEAQGSPDAGSDVESADMSLPQSAILLLQRPSRHHIAILDLRASELTWLQ